MWPERLEPIVNSSRVRVVGERETGEERESYEKNDDFFYVIICHFYVNKINKLNNKYNK